MKKLLLLSLLLLLAVPTAAAAQTLLTAYQADGAVQGSFVPQENLVRAGLTLVSETAAKRYELFGIGTLEKPAQGVVCPYRIELAAMQGLLRVTDLKGGTGEYFSAVSDKQRADLLTGALRVRVYRGVEYNAGDLLAECAVDPSFTEMTLSSTGVTNGVLADAFGKKGTQRHKGVPTRSLPLSIGNLPEGTRALALTMIDPDGQNWVHWLAANLPVTADLPENASIDLAEQMAQGKNDFGAVGYGGPTPPSGTHTYVITVYALSEPLPLKDGFKLKAFQKALDGKVLAAAVLKVRYSK